MGGNTRSSLDTSQNDTEQRMRNRALYNDFRRLFCVYSELLETISMLNQVNWLPVVIFELHCNCISENAGLLFSLKFSTFSSCGENRLNVWLHKFSCIYTANQQYILWCL